MALKEKLIILLLTIEYIISQDCVSKKTRDQCVKENLNAKKYEEIQCCWNENEGQCGNAPNFEDNYLPYLWIRKGYDCGTNADICERHETPRTGEYMECAEHGNIIAMYPDDNKLRCCYVGDGKHNKCMVLDIKKKSMFQKAIYSMRTLNEDYDGDYKIVCAGEYFNKMLVAFFAIILSFIFIA